ncbi:hypothetical protein [Tumebacillus permanentifrigoris]|uniref:Extracellular protein n=1 Tax=Tumebacillus permanentifrigoris TaxID=378543 RepID=A0A316D404_9BACL|nr:hypothetical protein [Tumebacillus permanentifrigoris]PWK06953.1 hypothetical protein C7459_11817 [Tumebacillus permanentifrigoris]
MKLKWWLQIVLVLLVTAMVPMQALAYSYGNPNEEALATAYKNFVAKLAVDPPDFAGAKAEFDPLKAEVDQHMGAEPAQAIYDALDKKDKDAAMKSYQQTLVLNVARRMKSIEADFTNYKDGKLLLAKALATYEALAPIVKEKDAQLDTDIRAGFDKALESLGNPGLFGVGVKAADPALFKTSEDTILNGLMKVFEMKELKVGHFAKDSNESAGSGTADTSDAAWKNWLPLVLIAVVFTAIVVWAMRRKRA